MCFLWVGRKQEMYNAQKAERTGRGYPTAQYLKSHSLINILKNQVL